MRDIRRVPADDALRKLGAKIENAHWPRPKCPNCYDARISFDSPDEYQDPGSLAARDHEAWEPEWIFGTFRLLGRCESPSCGQLVVGAGSFNVDGARQDREQQYSTWYSIDYLTPPLILMRVPESAPSSVEDGVARASRLLYADPDLAATALRAAVEVFLTGQGIAGTTASGAFVPAHKRITQWRKAGGDTTVADLLLAVKWIGNKGGHEVPTLTVKDVLDGVEFLDEAFHRLFVGPDIDVRAQAINAAKGP